MRSGACLVLALAAAFAATRSGAAPIVAGYERFGRHAPDQAGRVEAGLLLLGELGCANCHAAAGPALAQVSTKPAPLLDDVGRRAEPGWLADYLADPRGMHPGTTMPDLLAGLPRERRDRAATALAHFLASTGPFATTRYSWSVTGKATNELVYEQCGCAACHGSRREGVEPLADHRPLGDLGRKWHPAELDAFLKDPAKIRPGGRMPAMPLSDKERRGLVTSLVGGVDLADAPAAADFSVDPALAAEGRATFTTAGCAACHRLEGVGSRAREIPERARPLAELAAGEAGCLAERPPAAAADYGLDAGQRASLAAALAWLRSPEAAMPPGRAGAIDRSLTMLNCYACHDRDGKGGTLPAVATLDDDGEPVLVEAARDALFKAAQAELGDEGRRPPTLTAVGSKLRPEFLETVLCEGVRDRAAIMPTRMPKWTAAIGTPLAAALAADPPVACVIPALAGHDDDEVIAQGRHLVGAKALGCIKCHAFGGDKGQSLGLVDMTRMPVRLRHEWFLAYVADPQAYRRGTRMPASWPEGRTFHPDVLDGTASGQIEAVWRYLASVKPRPPIGAGRRVIELVPTDRPILYRNFIEDAGPRGIAVGYPEGVHIAWDAEAMRLALVWRGAFIDAGRHWSGRGEGWQPPLGDGVFAPDAGAAVETLPDAGASWPAEAPRSRGARFLGYSLDAAGRPTFRWRHGGMTVEEHVEPVHRDSDRVLRRTLRIAGRPAGGTAMIRAATGRVEHVGDGWWRVDGRWKVRLSGDRGEPVLRDESGDSDLRAPVAWTADGTAVIVEELAW